MSRDAAPNRSLLRGIARRAMIERGLQPDFSPAALEQARDAQPARAGGEARDLRELPWSSIDNDDSRDLDQLAAAHAEGDAVRLLVAIADVDACAPLGSPIDEHARLNTTSVYTPAQVFPMIPERLSTDLTSLNAGEDRMAVVADMTVADGTVTDFDLYRALVRNRARLTYDGVAAWLEGGPPPPELAATPGLDEQIRMQDGAARAMRRRRQERGALRVQTTEARVVFDGELVADLRRVEKNRAKELIEDLMIAANGATAGFLAARGFPSLRRVLRAPRRWDRIAALAAELGETLPDAPDPVALDGFLGRRRAADPARFPDLSVSVVKLLGSGEYAVELPGGASSEGHFGLALRDYTHSTAPNRRFPDLATQRLLKAAIAGRPPPYSGDQLAELARHCTVQEDSAAKVERQVRKASGALLLSSRAGETFDAMVTGASNKGTWVRILPPGPAVEGKVVRGAEGLDVGDRARVTLLGTDVERGFIDFARAR